MEKDQLKLKDRMDILLTPMEREKNNSNIKHLMSGSSLYSGTLSAIEREIKQAKSNMQMERLPQMGSFPRPLDDYPATAYGQGPILWPYLRSPLHAENRFHQSMLHRKIIPQAIPPTAGESAELQCVVCGIACTSVPELLNHITKKHIASEPDKRNFDVDVESMRKSSASSVSSSKEDSNHSKACQRKSSMDASSNLKDSDTNSQADFPIPKPNFALLSSYSNLPSISPTIGTIPGGAVHGPATMLANGLQLPVPNPQLKNLPSPMLMDAYKMLNPLFGYQNLGNANSVALASVTPGKPPPGFVGIAAEGFPCLDGGYLRAFPYIPTIPPVAVPHESALVGSNLIKSKSSSKDPSLESSVLINADTVIDKSKEQKGHPNIPSIYDLNVSHADSMRRRFSVPSMSLNKKFRAPYPCIRKTSISNGRHCVSFSQHKKVQQAYKGSLHHDALKRKRMSLTEKPSPSRLNAKSIEQHISKLISNNEKVLLNPALERVKPRRVFRRNSLDSASLSSYAAAISGCFPRDLPLFKEGEAISETRNMPGISSSIVISSARNLPPSPTYPHTVTSKLPNMVQLTRVPQTNPQLRNTTVDKDLKEQPGLPSGQLQQRADQDMSRYGPLENLDSAYSNSQTTRSGTKKLTQIAIFECGDCGVTYRNEENYKTHKQLYCKYKHVSTKSANVVKKTKSEGLENTTQFRRHFDLPEIPRVNITEENDSVKDDVADFKSAKTVSLRKGSVEGSASGLLGNSANSNDTTKSKISSDSVKLLRNSEFRRRKSAGATLQTELTLQSVRLQRSTQSTTHSRCSEIGKCDETVEQNSCVSVSAAAECITSNVSTLQDQSSVSGLTNFLPTSKLPPNKRHLMRHFEKSSIGCDDNQHSAMDCSSTEASAKPETTASGVATAIETTSSRLHINTTSTGTIMPVVSSVSTSNDINLSGTSVSTSDNSSVKHVVNSQEMQGIGRGTRFSQDTCIWSWQQIRNGLLDPKRDLPDMTLLDIPQSAPKTRNKFSVPSLLLQDPKVNRNSSPPNLAVSATSTSKSNRDFQPSLVAQKKRSQIPVEKCANIEATGSLTSQAMKEPVSASSMNIPRSVSSVHNTATSGLPGQTLAPLGSNSATVTSPLRRSSAFSNDIECIKVVSCVAGRFSKVSDPHPQPAMSARTDVCYCCVVNPQPTCMEVSKKDSKCNPLSMYKEWTAAESSVSKSEITFADMMTGWRRPRCECSGGVASTAKGNCGLIITREQDYNKFKQKAEARNHEKKSETFPTDDSVSANEEVCNGVNKKQHKTSIPVFIPSAPFTNFAKPIYASCHQLHGASTSGYGPLAVGTSAGASNCPLSLKYAAKDHSLAKTLCSEIVTTFSETIEKGRFKREQNPIASSVSEGSSELNCDNEKSPVQSDHSSSRATDSDSDPIDRRIELFGKVKRRRTRRERTASSPRAKRRALQCISPFCPSVLNDPPKKHRFDQAETSENPCTLSHTSLTPSTGGMLNEAAVLETQQRKSKNAVPRIGNSLVAFPSSQSKEITRATSASVQSQIGLTFCSEDSACRANDIPPFVGSQTLPTSFKSKKHHFRFNGLSSVETDMTCTATTSVQSTTQGQSVELHQALVSKGVESCNEASSLLESSLDLSSMKKRTFRRLEPHACHSQSSTTFTDSKIQSKLEVAAPNLSSIQIDGVEKYESSATTDTSSALLPKLCKHNSMPLECASSFHQHSGLSDVVSLTSEKVIYSLSQAKRQHGAAATEVVSENSQKPGFGETEAFRERPALQGSGFPGHEPRPGAGYQKDASCGRSQDDAKNVDDPVHASRIGHFCTKGDSELTRDVICADRFQPSETMSTPFSSAQGEDKPNHSSEVQNLSLWNRESSCGVPICYDNPERLTGDTCASPQPSVPQDPRPFKCITCDVAFRFQGHLDRHFRSNAHLFAINHCTQDNTISEALPNDDNSRNSTRFVETEAVNEVPGTGSIYRTDLFTTPLRDRASSFGCDSGTHTQRKENILSGSTALKSGLQHLTNHQAVSQLRVHSSDQSGDSIPLPRNVAMQCQVSCT